MNIIRENVDDLNVVLKLELVKADYDERVAKILKDYKKKAVVPGFRPGMVPIGMINKMYRKPVLADELNKLVSESLSKFLIEEKLNILGEPLPHNGDNKTIDWDKDEDFEFKFDLGMAPEFELKVTNKDKVTKYNITVDDSIIDKYIESYTQRFGQNVKVEEINDNDILTVSVVQLSESGEALEGGIANDWARMLVSVIKDEKIKKQVLKLKKGDSISMDLRKAFPNDTEIASILKIKPDEAANLSGNFKIDISDIERYERAEVNQELFDKIYGEGQINSTEEFRKKIGEEAALGLKSDSEYKFKLDVRETLLKKFKAALPEEFLKRWLHTINEGKFSMEEIEKDFDKFLLDLKWQLIKDKIAIENQLTVSEADLREAAKENALYQFRYYGMNNVPEEHLETFANRILEDKEQLRKIRDNKLEDKIIEFVGTAAKIEEKEISSEKFNKLFEEK